MKMSSFFLMVNDAPVAHIEYEGTGTGVKLLSCTYYKPEDKFTLRLGLCPSDETLRDFFEKRHAPKFRFNDFIRNEYDIKEYNAEQMTRISHGAMPTDSIWCKFDTDPEDLTFADVSLR